MKRDGDFISFKEPICPVCGRQFDRNTFENPNRNLSELLTQIADFKYEDLLQGVDEDLQAEINTLLKKANGNKNL